MTLALVKFPDVRFPLVCRLSLDKRRIVASLSVSHYRSWTLASLDEITMEQCTGRWLHHLSEPGERFAIEAEGTLAIIEELMARQTFSLLAVFLKEL